MYQLRPRSWCNPSFSVISAEFMALGRSCSQSQNKCEEGMRGAHLLVGKDQEHGIAQLILLQHACKLVLGLTYTLAIVAVDDEDQA